MIKGTTATGFEFAIEDDILDDYELLETLVELDKGNYGRITELTDRLLGKEQTASLKEHIRKKGRVHASEMLNEVMEVFKACKNGKN